MTCDSCGRDAQCSAVTFSDGTVFTVCRTCRPAVEAVDMAQLALFRVEEER